MKASISFAMSLFLALASTASPAAQPPGPRVLDRGLDGEIRYYSVICPNGRRTALEHKYKEGEICFDNPDGEAVCLRNSNPDDAARRLCNQRR